MENLKKVICEKRSYARKMATHQHEFGQFLFPLQGSLDIQTAWKKVNLEPTHCFYLPPKSDHHFRSFDRNEFLILDIPTHYLPEDTSMAYERLDEHWSAIRFLLLEEADRKDDTSLTNLTRYVANKLRPSKQASIEYIDQHYNEPIRLETLAAMEHYHPAYYSAWFKKQTGKTVKAYVSDLRLKEAKNLLLSTGWSMSRISEEIGFENSSSFTRWFKQAEGRSPQNYRHLNKG